MFSEIFNVSEQEIKNYGAVNISLIADIPLFIDPILIFNSEKKEYKKLHENIVNYLYFLAKKANNGLTKSEIKTWFSFNEICNNWLGFSKAGNKGLALDKKFADFLSKNIGFVIKTNDISSSVHLEKIMLLTKGQGKDKISDLTANLIKGYLCEYTEKFAKKYIKDNNKAKMIPVDKVEFNYNTESFVSKEYYLPYIINKKGEEEYVLLTPSDILRKDEQAINKVDFLNKYKDVRNSIGNSVLRTQIDNYIQKAIREYEEKCKNLNQNPKGKIEEKIAKKAFEEYAQKHQEIYDYYVKIIENDSNKILREASNERLEQETKFIENTQTLTNIISNNYKKIIDTTNSFNEAVNRVKFLKDIFENKEGYKLFYDSKKDKVMYSSEKDLQILFKFVWHETFYKVDAETNNGDGPADFVVSYGVNDSCVVEFKLASNPKIKHVFAQTDVYKKANNTNKLVIVIFYFEDKDYKRVLRILKEQHQESEINKSIFLIDCRRRESASNRK